MTRRKILHSTDYTVGWICALPTELSVSRLMLDEQHGPAIGLTSINDHNTYTLGRIRNHNVVMTCLPCGAYGTVSAAVTAHQMVSTFPSIQYGFVVGVGGGAPSLSADIRLGDVVVGTPTNGFSGVIPYDYGKKTAGEHPRCHRVLNKPPQILLASMAEIQANHQLRGSEIPRMIHEAKQRIPAFSPHLTCPGSDYDWLFDATYEHLGTGQSVCRDACDLSNLIPRHPRASQDPVIHYGLVASGSQVIKHARTRDDFAQRLGVLCFEMEAAGIMDQLPSLIVRGISDYADSHKNKVWQRYAAATAAGYAKEILSVTPAGQKFSPMAGLSSFSTPVLGTYWNVPLKRNPSFTGREHEVEKLTKAIQENTQMTTIALTGLGGVGKTQIALEVAYRVHEKDPELSIFWISASSMETIEHSWIRLCETLGVSVADPAQARGEATRYLNNSMGPWLMIVDGLDDMDVWDSNKPYLTSNKKGLILFTTRNRKLAVKLASPKQIYEVSAMGFEEAGSLLGHHLIDQTLLEDHQSRRKLLTQLTCLPLAITQAASYINANGISIADYLSLLNQQEQDAIDILSESFDGDGEPSSTTNSIASTWTVSFRNIQRSDNLAIEYLALLACLDPQNIPSSLLPSAESTKKQTDTIGTLSAYAFIQRQRTIPTSNSQLLNVHPLVHLAIRNWLRENKALVPWMTKAIRQLDNAFPEHDSHRYRTPTQIFGSWRCYLPHANYVMKKTKNDISLHRVNLLEKYGLCLHTDGRYRDAEEPLLTVLQARTKLFGPQDRRTLNCMNNLALVYSNQSLLATAESLQTQACDFLGKSLGATHPYTLAGMNTLSTIYQKQGRWCESEILGLKVVEQRKSVLGIEHPTTLNSMENLGCTYQEQGRWKEAEELISQVFLARRRLNGDHDLDTLRSMNNLALLHVNQEEWDRAIDLYRRAVETAGEVLGAEHPDTISYSSNLAYAYYGKCMLAEAHDLGSQAWELCNRVLGASHSTTLISMANLASVKKELGHESDAFDLQESCVRVSRDALGPDHSFTMSVGDMLQEWEMARDGFDSLTSDLFVRPSPR